MHYILFEFEYLCHTRDAACTGGIIFNIQINHVQEKLISFELLSRSCFLCLLYVFYGMQIIFAVQNR